MIPKKIHYCWFGKGKKNEVTKKCIDSWEKYLPDYELIEWNEDNFDINSNPYVKQAYQAQKYAFVTDYVRLYALYSQGGVYMDTDMEVLENLDVFLNHKAFTGMEDEEHCVTGIMGAEKEHKWIKLLLNYYKDRNFLLSDGSYDETTNTKTITNLTTKNYGWLPENRHQILKEDLNIYPFEIFCAKNFETGEIIITDNTKTIHHFSGTWLTGSKRLRKKVSKFISPNIRKFISVLKNKSII